MPLSAPQKIITDCTARFRVAICGRRFGKSFMSIREMARFARRPGSQVCYIAPSYRQARQTIWKLLRTRLLDLNWVRKINETDLSITLVNDSVIMLRSADNYDSMRGLGLDFVVFDEFADIAPETWSEVIRPALSDRQGHALFIGSPKGMNWAKDMWDRGASGQKDWASFQFTTLDGGNVTAEEIEAARQDLDERTFRQEYLATWETFSGIIYYNFDMHRNVVPTEYSLKRGEILHVGCDYNCSPLVAVISKVTDNQIHVIDEIKIDGSNTYELCEEIVRRYPEQRIWVYPDASGQARRTSSRDSDHNIMRQAGFTLKVRGVNPAVKDRIASVNSSLCSASGQVRLTIDPKCRNVIHCLSRQTYKNDTHLPDKTSGFDHMNDALGYLTHWINPVRKPETDVTGDPQSWGAY